MSRIVQSLKNEIPTRAFELASKIEQYVPEVALEALLEEILDSVDGERGGELQLFDVLERTVDKLR